MKIVEQLIELANNKPDDKELVERVNELFLQVGSDFTDAEKIDAFDKIAASIASTYGSNSEAHRGIIYEDSDWIHYLYEDVMQAVVGDGIFKAKNKLFESC